MNQQGSSESRSPRTPILTPNRQCLYSPKSDHDQRQQQQSQQQRNSSSWWSGFWSSAVVADGTPKQSKNHHQPQIQRTPDYDHTHLNGHSKEGIHHSLMVPQVEDESTTTATAGSTYRLQPRQIPKRRMMVMDEEEDVYYIASNHQKSLSPLRNRSPKIPSRPPMVAHHHHQQSPSSSRSSPRSPSFFQYQPYSPARTTLTAEEPSKSKSESLVLRHMFFGTAKRRAAFWTVLSILMLGPTMFLGAGNNSNNNVSRHGGVVVWSSNDDIFLGPYEAVSSEAFSDPAHRALANLYDTNTFMVQDQVLNAGQSRALQFSNEGITLKQESNGNLVLYNRSKIIWETGLDKRTSPTTAYMTILQADGNLITRSMTFNMRLMAWTTSVEWSTGSHSRSVHHGEYALMLTQNADGLMIVRRFDGKIMWSTTPAQFEPPLRVPAFTQRPTPAPVRPRPQIDLTLDLSPPVSIPQVVVAPPSVSPPGFPSTVPQSQEYSIQSGPMVGHTTHNSCKFWVFLGRNIPMQLVYWRQGAQEGSVKSSTLVPDAGANNAAIKTIQDLQPDTVYQYEIRINNKWLSQGQFKTAPSPDQPTSFKYVLASCMDVKSSVHRNQPVWNEIQKKNVDFAMLPGDTVYLNYLDWTRQWEVLYGRVWYRNLQQRAEQNFARFIKSVPTYGTWDNHDYGTEYADRNQRGKDNSLKAWRDLWPNPYQGSSKGPGNYYSFSWGDVDFFVMDCRWYRSWGLGILFGDAQLAWLEEKLVASKATFKIIVSATDVMEQDMTGDLKSIGDIVTRHSISGVLFNAGDIHRNEYKAQNIANWPYKVHQFSSSGIGVEWRRNFAIVNVNTASLSNPEVRVDFYSANDDSSATSWSNHNHLECGLIPGTNNRHAQCTQSVRLSDLTP